MTGRLARASLWLSLIALAACMTPTGAEDPLAGPRLDASVYALPDGLSLGIEVGVLVDGPPFRVRRWLTEEALLEKWLAEDVVGDPRGESEILLRWPSSDLELRLARSLDDPPATGGLDDWWIVAPYGSMGESRLRIDVVEEAGLSRVRLEQLPFALAADGEEVADAHRRAWSHALLVLRSAYERGLPTTPEPRPSPGAPGSSVPPPGGAAPPVAPR